MSNYWVDRVNRQNNINFNRSAAATDKKLAELYKKTGEQIAKDIKKLYANLDVPEDEIRINDLYKNNQFYELLGKINKQLTKLGEDEIKINNKTLLGMYNKTSKMVSNQAGFSVGFEDGAQAAIDKIWCPDGKHWSSRVWKNKSVMQAQLEQGITDCVARGLSKEKLITEITEKVNKDRYKASRLVRTELTYVQNAAAADTYEKAGCKKYEYCAALDNRTSEECEELNGQQFYFAEAVVGENFPPMHANCRCTIVPVFDDEEDGILENKTIEANGREFNIVDRNEEDEKIITNAFNVYTSKEQAFLNNFVKGVEMIDTKNGESFYNPNNKKIYLSKTADERISVHELAHALQDAMSLNTDYHYVKIMKNNFPSVSSILKNIEYNEEQCYYFFRNPRFVSQYQGRVYDFTAINKMELMKEYFSVGYETYIYEPELLKKKDIDLYNFIKERVRG